MALTRDQKQAQVADLTEKMSNASSVIFAHYTGLSVAEVSELRLKLREQGAEMKVAKKTLAKIAAKECGYPELTDESMEGPVSFIFSFEDPLSGAQVAFKFGKEHDQVALIGGVFEGKVLSKEEAVELAKMPSREQLLAKFVGMIQSPLISFAGMCSSPLSGFARAISQVADNGGFGDEPAPAEEAPAEEAPAEEAPVEEAKDAEETKEETAEETSVESEDSNETPAEENAESEAPTEEASADDAEEKEEAEEKPEE